MTTPDGIVVLGAPRSGTTMLRRILDAHASIVCPPETTVLSACARFLREQPLDNGVRFGVLEGLCQVGFSEEEVLKRLRDFAFGFHRENAALQGVPRWAEKTAADIFHLDGIERLCGEEVRYVGLLRHGLDVAVSMADLTTASGGYLDELHGFLQREHRPKVAFAEAWRVATNALLDLAERRPEQVHLLRYEDLVTDPMAHLEPLFAFLELPFEPSILERALEVDSAGFGDWKTYARSAIDTKSVGRYKRDLSKHMRAEIGTALNPTLERAGYPPVKIPKIRAVDAAKRMEMAMRMHAMRRETPE